MSRGRILIVDDEPDICELIAEVAEARGFEAEVMTRSERLESRLAEYGPRGVVLDLNMPGLDGIEALRLLAEARRPARVALISGYDSRILATARQLGEGLGLQVVATLEKPIEPATLREALDALGGEHAGAELAANLAAALDSGALELSFRPKVDLHTGAVAGLEASARLRRPGQEAVALAEIAPALDEAGLGSRAVEATLAGILDAAAAWRAEGLDLPVSVDLRAADLRDLAFPDRVGGMLSVRGLPAGSLVIEIGEDAAAREGRRILDGLLRLRLKGVGLALDRFGRGHASFDELRRMPFAEVKIAPEFVAPLASRRDCATIVHSIIDLGHNLGLKVTAEGVGSGQVWQMLVNRGCDLGQGDGIAPDLPTAEVTAWVRGWRGGRLA